MKQRILLISLLVFVVACVPVRPPSGKANKKIPSKIEGEAGRTLPIFSISIDANYDDRLDNLIYGYKLLPVSIKNMSLRLIPMDAKKDRWVIVGDAGQRHRAVNTLRFEDEKTWREMPEKLRSLIDYPEVIPIDYSVTFDLLLPEHADLKYFREIRYYNAAWKKEFILEKQY